MGSLTRRTAIALAAVVLTGSAIAQTFPAQPLRWVVPYPAGGGTDVIARTVANEMQQSLGQAIAVDNRAGANTIVGADFISKARADGYTMGSADNATLALNPALYEKLPYNAEKDFTVVGGIARFPYVLLVGPKATAKTLGELIAQAKSNPGSVSYGSPGMGGPNHVAMEQLQQRLGIKLNHIAYKGAAPGLQDLIAGQIDCMLVDTGSSLPHVRGGKLRALAVSYDRRLTPLPDVPTFAEAGAGDFSAFSWQFLIAPAGTPQPVVSQLSQHLNKALESEAVLNRMRDLGVEPSPMDSKAAATFVSAEAKRWSEVIRSAGIKLEN
jgi:tripartite-type tricarboxylate transporter receptor subunit TctC